MKSPSTTDHGEGNAEAARCFNKSEIRFGWSVRSKRLIRSRVRVQLEEQSRLNDAEQRGTARARGRIPMPLTGPGPRRRVWAGDYSISGMSKCALKVRAVLCARRTASWS